MDFTYQEWRLIRFAIETEIMRREDNPQLNPKKLEEFERLYDKVDKIIQDMKNSK